MQRIAVHVRPQGRRPVARAAGGTIARGGGLLLPSHDGMMEALGSRRVRRAAPALPGLATEPFYRVILHYHGWPKTDNQSLARRVRALVAGMAFTESLRVVIMAFVHGSAIVKTLPLRDAAELRDILEGAGFIASIDLA